MRNDWIVEALTSPSLSVTKRHCLVEALNRNPNATEEQLKELISRDDDTLEPRSVQMQTLGVFGNVWIRQQYYPKADQHYLGHTHDHDHVSLLVRGGLMVHVEGEQPFEVWAAGSYREAPTFFGVRAEKEHKLVPLVDNTVAYCLFAYDEENEKMLDLSHLRNVKFHG